MKNKKQSPFEMKMRQRERERKFCPKPTRNNTEIKVLESQHPKRRIKIQILPESQQLSTPSNMEI